MRLINVKLLTLTFLFLANFLFVEPSLAREPIRDCSINDPFCNTEPTPIEGDCLDGWHWDFSLRRCVRNLASDPIDDEPTRICPPRYIIDDSVAGGCRRICTINQTYVPATNTCRDNTCDPATDPDCECNPAIQTCDDDGTEEECVPGVDPNCPDPDQPTCNRVTDPNCDGIDDPICDRQADSDCDGVPNDQEDADEPACDPTTDDDCAPETCPANDPTCSNSGTTSTSQFQGFIDQIGGQANFDNFVNTNFGNIGNFSNQVNSIGGIGQFSNLFNSVGGLSGFNGLSANFGGVNGLFSFISNIGGIASFNQLLNYAGGPSQLAGLISQIGMDKFYEIINALGFDTFMSVLNDIGIGGLTAIINNPAQYLQFLGGNFGGLGINVTMPGINLPADIIPQPTRVSAMLCEVRQMFCGTLGFVLTATAIFVLGLLTLIGKMNWPFAVVIAVCMVIFMNAGQVTRMITNNGWLGFLTGDNPLCICL